MKDYFISNKTIFYNPNCFIDNVTVLDFGYVK